MSQPRDQPEPFVRHGDQLEQFLVNFWQRQVDAAETDPPPYGRHPPLPLARIKKVMKSDPDVRMIASDAPVLFCKACESTYKPVASSALGYVTPHIPRLTTRRDHEITCRAFLVADAHKRRTISKADIAKALAKSDHFDFLIDVVPRDEAERAKTQKAINSGLEAEAAAAEQANVMGSGSQHQLSPTTSMHAPAVLGGPGVYPPPPGSHLQQLGHMMQPPMHPQPPMHHRSHSHSHSQGMVHQHQHQMSQQTPMISPIGMGMGNQPPPLIPNARGTGQTQSQGMPQAGGSQQQQQQQQQGANGTSSNGRRSSVSRMSLSPTIPLSSSRMDPPSSL
ncbi:SubName: Full=Unplaced genomic scaffold CY34scaffold_73, whole genome shotgun sequence {ECO:0000313/EMBL:KIK43818.1} [Serendipita indica DSM 11827]|nr:SubName: Full=Unplaced genomic scaffold CY34scaffold_73, whole genome shotgun sequence {ECO:0000313/EMBL:KIK43818.1} [Serendipita indica DSM 11827]